MEQLCEKKKVATSEPVVIINTQSPVEGGKFYIGVRRLGPLAPVSKFESTVSNFSSWMETVEKAERGQKFQVAYFPDANLPSFCVERRLVDSALAIGFQVGHRVSMKKLKVEDHAELEYRGVITAVGDQTQLWNSIQVHWNKSMYGSRDKFPQAGVECVCPWQLDLMVGQEDDAGERPAKKVKIMGFEVDAPPP